MQKSFLVLLISTSLSCASAIKSINFKGLEYISPDVARKITGLKVGEELTPTNSNNAILNLYKQGYFEDIILEEDQGRVLIILKEKQSIANLSVEGTATNDKDTIKKVINLNPGEMIDNYKEVSAKKNVRRFYDAKGYFDTTIGVKKTPIDQNKTNVVSVNFDINRGQPIIINKVNLEGAKVLDYSDIEPYIANKQKEFLGWMWGFNDGKVKIADLGSDSEKIKEQYYKKGYINANVTPAFLNTNFSNYTANLTYYINEGKQYKVGKISINAPKFLNLDDKELIENFKLKKGQVVNIEKMKKDISSLETLIANKGYAYVQVVPQTTQDPKTLTMNIDYKIIPGDKVYIKNVLISGNDKTLDTVVRREIYLTEGYLYNKTDIEESINALRRTGYFDDVSIKQQKVSDNEINLDVKVKEAPTGSITGGIGYGSEDGLLLNAGIVERNIFGTGIQANVNIDKSDDTLSGNIGLTNPRVFDSAYSLGGSIFATDYDWDDYKERSYGFTINSGRKIGRYTNVNLTYLFQHNKIHGLNMFYEAAGYRNGRSTKSSIIPSIVFNNTDDYFIPRSGAIADSSLEYAGLGGDVKFLKAKAGLKYYFDLKDYIDWDVILRYKAGIGAVFDTAKKKDIPVNDRLFLGGMSTIRGYDSRSIPKELICISGHGCDRIEVGGLRSFNTSFEVSLPLIDKLKMRLIGFFDYGMIGQNSFNEEKRYSTGGGIEWITPIAPLQLYFVKPLNKKKYDSTNSFEFSIGRRF